MKANCAMIAFYEMNLRFLLVDYIQTNFDRYWYRDNEHEAEAILLKTKVHKVSEFHNIFAIISENLVTFECFNDDEVNIVSESVESFVRCNSEYLALVLNAEDLIKCSDDQLLPKFKPRKMPHHWSKGEGENNFASYSRYIACEPLEKFL
jgi:hypothetical protein